MAIPPERSRVLLVRTLGRELFCLVVRAREAGREPEMELRAVARRYRDLVRAWERSEINEYLFDYNGPCCLVKSQSVTADPY